jgi:hypothetical protein
MCVNMNKTVNKYWMEKQVAEEYLLYNFIYVEFNKASLSDFICI